MKQYMPLMFVSAFVVFIVVALASQFIDLPSIGTLIENLTADPNAQKEQVLIQARS